MNPIDPNSPTREPTGQATTALRSRCLELLQIKSPIDKAAQVRGLDATRLTLDRADIFPQPQGLPGRPERPLLVHPSQLKTRAVGTLEGRAGLIHALTHIEANAINLALDIVWRFPGMPADFYLDWWRVAQEEALHFELLNAHLVQMGFAYGDFPAHDGLWDMAERTQGDILARLALVPRTLEARGLDATPAVRNRL
ncbi:MAG: ferritin-like domain-containing protein, partial [Rhodoferax sp.]|nr:ferritin-like domain-containing protein [Rhodoferax sp.]